MIGYNATGKPIASTSFISRAVLSPIGSPKIGMDGSNASRNRPGLLSINLRKDLGVAPLDHYLTMASTLTNPLCMDNIRR